MNKETINNWKDGDVFLWSYNEVEYEARKNHHDMYWCCSKIGIVKGDKLEDTFWGSSSNRVFSKDDATNKLELIYKGNLNNYVVCRKEDQAMYEQSDSDVKCTEVKEAFKYDDVQCYHVDNKLSDVVVVNGIHIHLGSIVGWEGMLDIDLGEVK